MTYLSVEEHVLSERSGRDALHQQEAWESTMRVPAL